MPDPTAAPPSSSYIVLVSAAVSAVVAFVISSRGRFLEMQSVSRALSHEVLLLKRKLQAFGSGLMAEADASPKGRAITVEARPITADDIVVFKSSPSKIGLLYPTLGLRTLKFYRMSLESVGRLGATYPKVLTVDDARAIGKAIYDAARYSIDHRVLGELKSFGQMPYFYWLWVAFINTRYGRWLMDRLGWYVEEGEDGPAPTAPTPPPPGSGS